VRWAIASGWALDLFLGTPSRYHDDLDVEIARADQVAVQKALLRRGWRLDQVVEGGVYAPWPEGEVVRDGVHQVHGRRDEAFVDVLLAPRSGDAWAYRRDERVTLPLARAIRTTEGSGGGNAAVPGAIPYLAPEAVLLFKSRSGGGGKERPEPRPKDSADFERVLPHLQPGQRSWLTEALERVHGVHPWIERLRDSP
jgi:hypothetical protein